MRRTVVRAAVVMALASGPHAEGDDDPPPRIGRIPRLEVSGALLIASGITREDPDDTSGFGGGGQLDLHAEPGRKALVTLSGTLAAGAVPWTFRANVVLGSTLGLRTQHHVFSLVDSRRSGNTVTETYRIEPRRQIPLYLGLLLGTSVIHTDGGTATMIELGGAAISPQMHFVLAPTYSFARNGPGLRFGIGYAPGVAGRSPIFFRFSGDVGGGDAFGTVFTIAAGFGSSIGI